MAPVRFVEKRSLILMLMLSLVVGVAAERGFAEEPAQSSNSKASPTEAKDHEEGALEVVVTASRGPRQNPLDVPQSLVSVQKEEIATSALSTVEDLVHQVPNVAFAPADGNPNFWQQGFTIRGLGGQRVLTLSDGVRQAGQGIGYGGGNLSLYDPFQIERIEILRGPASVLYGTDSFGGVINVITREPKRRDSFGFNGGAKYFFDAARELNRMGAYLDAGDESVNAVLGGAYTHANDPNLPDDVDPESGGYRSLDWWGKLDFHFSPDTKLRVVGNVNRNMDIRVLDSDITLPIAMFPPPGSMVPVNSPLAFQFPLYQRSLLGTELVSENVSDVVDFFKTGVYWQQIRREFHRETAFYPTGSPGFAGPPLFVDPFATVTRSVVDTNDRVNAIEWQSQSRLNFDPHALSVGFDLGYDRSNLPESEDQFVAGIAGQGVVPPTLTSSEERIRAKADQLRLGVFTQDSWNLNPFELVPGFRFDFHTVDDKESSFNDDVYGLSGTIGTVYHVTKRESLYLNLATGFRAPDLGERFQDGIVNLGAPSRIIGKADLDAERSYSAEWGAKGRTGNFDYDGAVFYNHVSDYIGLRSLGIVDGFVTDQYDNVGKVNLYGAEAAARYRVTEQWRVFANGARTWTDEREKVDIPNWIFNYGTDYAIPVNEFGIETITPALVARSELKSRDYTESGGRDRFEGPGFSVLDLKLTLDVGKTEFGRGALLVGCRNITNRKYKEPFFNQYQPERSVFAGVELSF